VNKEEYLKIVEEEGYPSWFGPWLLRMTGLDLETVTEEAARAVAQEMKSEFDLLLRMKGKPNNAFIQ